MLLIITRYNTIGNEITARTKLRKVVNRTAIDAAAARLCGLDDTP